MKDETDRHGKIGLEGSPIPISRHFDRTRGRNSIDSGTSYRLALLMALLATLTLEIAAAEGDQPAWMTAFIVICEATIVLVFGLIARWINAPDHSDLNPQTSSSPHHHPGNRVEATSPAIWILCLATVPLIIEVVVRGLCENMLPLELLFLAYFRNGVLALAVFSFRSDCQRMCCSLSTFLTIFASALSSNVWLHGLVVLFTVAGIWWLMGTYWESLSGRLAATSARQPPRRWLIAMPLLVLILLLGIPVTATKTHALSGFMPSSGGSDWYSEAARSGVGDGDALVAGTTNIQSFAPIDNAPFLNSHSPSLYDLFDDSYDEPVLRKNQDRAIALSREFASNQREHHLAESKQAGKEFSTFRRFGKARQKKIADRDSNALLYVKGRVPLHLKLEVFDRFDGIDWLPELLPETSPRLAMELIHGRPWLRVSGPPTLDIYGPPETHALKIVHLDTNRIPTPTQLLGIHVDKVDREDFYDWAQPGIIRMDREKIPSFSVVHVQSSVIDERLTRKQYAILSGGQHRYREIEDDDQSQNIRQLAKDVTKNIGRGWPQVKAIESYLRQEYILDHDARPPADCEHTAGHFLFESHRGPDYQFASAAVTMLRSLGYSSRLVSGFYADPSRYDPRSRQTPVLPQDVHFWAEVLASGDRWIPIEPTPGYELLRPAPTLVEQFFAVGLAGWRWVMANLMWVLSLAALSIWLIYQRCFLIDQVATTIWRCWLSHDKRLTAMKTLRLLEARCRRAGITRPAGITTTRWLARIARRYDDSERQTADQFIRLAEWAEFGPSTILPPADEAVVVCLCAQRIWSWSRIVRLKSSPRPPMKSVHSSSPYSVSSPYLFQH